MHNMNETDDYIIGGGLYLSESEVWSCTSSLLYETSGILFADGERALIYYEAFLWHVPENTLLACVRALFLNL